ncbi:MFS transporter [Rapidithrix thailandica]|uniref:MFS transporter n=1 Tax=Rapidithrix thailandica TaxID=413964 RepID=A0AAW9SBX5_9BACT
MKTYNKKYQRISTLSVFLLIPLSGLAIDVYIPSFPEMQQELHTESAGIQLTLTCFLISYGLTQLFTGSIVDSFGRYRLTLYSLLLFTLSSFAIAVIHNIYFIYSMRVIQGIATAFIVVGKRAFLVDIYSGKKLQHYTSLITIVWSVAPISAPFIGGYLQKGFGWTANFYLLGAYSLVTLIIECFFSGETLSSPKKFKRKSILSSYAHVLKSTDFSIGLMILGLCYSMVMVFGMTAPFLVENRFHFTPVVTGYCALISGFGLMTGGILGKSISHYAFFPKLIYGIIAAICVAVFMFVSSNYVSNIYTLMGFVFVMHMLSGFVYNVYFTYCLIRFPQHAGVASGLTSGGSYLMTSIASYSIISLLTIDSQSGMAISYLLLSLAAIPLLLLAKKAIDKYLLGSIATPQEKIQEKAYH